MFQDFGYAEESWNICHHRPFPIHQPTGPPFPKLPITQRVALSVCELDLTRQTASGLANSSWLEACLESIFATMFAITIGRRICRDV